MPAAVETSLNCMTVGAFMAIAQGSIDTIAGLYPLGITWPPGVVWDMLIGSNLLTLSLRVSPGTLMGVKFSKGRFSLVPEGINCNPVNPSKLTKEIKE